MFIKIDNGYINSYHIVQIVAFGSGSRIHLSNGDFINCSETAADVLAHVEVSMVSARVTRQVSVAHPDRRIRD